MVAAGSGSRLGADVPKALVTLGGVSLVRRCVDSLARAGVGRIVVMIPAGEGRAFADALKGVAIPVTHLEGGERRQDSVRLGLEALAGVGDGAHILVHDAARPLVPASVVERVVRALRDGARAVVPTMPVVDSIREASNNASTVVDRSRLRAVQTPQGFILGTLRDAHRLVHTSGVDITDDAAACEAAGVPVVLVDGDRRALKITEPIDMMVAEAIVATEGTP